MGSSLFLFCEASSLPVEMTTAREAEVQMAEKTLFSLFFFTASAQSSHSLKMTYHHTFMLVPVL